MDLLSDELSFRRGHPSVLPRHLGLGEARDPRSPSGLSEGIVSRLVSVRWHCGDARLSVAESVSMYRVEVEVSITEPLIDHQRTFLS